MATSTQVREFRSTLDDLTTVATAELLALVRALTSANPIDTRDALMGALPEVLQPYVTAAGELSAVWYEDLRAEAAVTSSFSALVDDEVDANRYQALARWAVGPLFGQSESTVTSLLVGGSERVILDGSRNTIDANARKDPASVSWQRVARPNACAFCRMLAGRGAVYRSKQAAGMVVGRGVDPAAAFDENGNRKRGGIGAGVKARGTRAVDSDKYHDKCHCTAVPTFYEIGSYTDPRSGRSEPALVPISGTPVLLEAA